LIEQQLERRPGDVDEASPRKMPKVRLQTFAAVGGVDPSPIDELLFARLRCRECRGWLRGWLLSLSAGGNGDERHESGEPQQAQPCGA
jgi:hypothetical protein